MHGYLLPFTTKRDAQAKLITSNHTASVQAFVNYSSSTRERVTITSLPVHAASLYGIQAVGPSMIGERLLALSR